MIIWIETEGVVSNIFPGQALTRGSEIWPAVAWVKACPGKMATIGPTGIAYYTWLYSAIRRQAVITVYMKSNNLLLFVFASVQDRCSWHKKLESISEVRLFCKRFLKSMIRQLQVSFWRSCHFFSARCLKRLKPKHLNPWPHGWNSSALLVNIDAQHWFCGGLMLTHFVLLNLHCKCNCRDTECLSGWVEEWWREPDGGRVRGRLVTRTGKSGRP